MGTILLLLINTLHFVEAEINAFGLYFDTYFAVGGEMLVTLFRQVTVDAVYVLAEALEACFRKAKEEVAELQAICVTTLAEGELTVECLIYYCHNG